MTAAILYCGDCRSPLTPGSRKCGCGWAVPSAGGSSSGVRYRRCAFAIDGMQCPLPAQVYLQPYGKGAPGYCPLHVSDGDRVQDAATVERLREIIADPQAALPRRRDWRDREVDRLVAERAQDHRRVGETSEAYRARMRDQRGAGLVRFERASTLPGGPVRRPIDVEEFVEAVEDRAARVQAEQGIDPMDATREALRAVLRDRIGGAR